MGRRTPKPSGRLSRGPWTGPEIRRRLESVGWFKVAQKGSHVQMHHPSRRGRVTVDVEWTEITTRTDEFGSVAAQAGLSRKELQRLLG